MRSVVSYAAGILPRIKNAWPMVMGGRNAATPTTFRLPDYPQAAQGNSIQEPSQRSRTVSEPIVISLIAYRIREAGYQDRLNGLPPQTTDDSDYFHGYCEAVCDEIVRERIEIDSEGADRRHCLPICNLPTAPN